ncbi:MAG: phosphohistidine phosphatase SixA [Spirochaetales bacterium]|nr:phosphohistidine phosphatase SixA [Spirochaetales bacterium]
MKLYLLRHGDAEIYSQNGDRGRELSDLGRNQSRKAGRYLKDVHPGVVLMSTFVRAKQTLEIVNREGGSCALREFVSLDVSPSGSLEDLMIEINTYREDSVCVVGHNPQLSNLIEYLTGEKRTMGNCSFAEIDLESKKLIEFKTVEEM